MEAPPEVLARKAWLRVKPRFYRLAYRRAASSAGRPIPDRIARVMANLALLPSQRAEGLEAGYSKRAEERAAAALDGRFPVLGYGEAPIPLGPAWHRDPFHGHEWPPSFFAEVDFIASGVRCDVKIPWELSRLQFLVWLAEGARAGGPNAASCLERFEAILADWLAANPPGFGVNWTCGMEVAIRAVNLVFASALIVERLSDKSRHAIARSLIDHRTFLDRFPEYSDVTGNHYLADLMGIAVLTCVLDGPRSSGFARSASLFTAEADRQFEGSGTHLEYAPVYHRLCMDMLMIVHALASVAGEALAKPLEPVLQRAMRLADAIASPGGMLPIFGDCDSGHVVWFGGDARRLDAARAYCYGRGVEGREGDLALFLARFRRSGGALFERQPAEAGLCGPFVTMESGHLKLVARHGPQGLKGLAPHDHDDALAFWAFLGDEDLLIELGCLPYTLDPVGRRATIVSSGHSLWSVVGSERFTPVEGSVFETVRGAPYADVRCRREGKTSICELDLRGHTARSLAETRRFTLSNVLRIDDIVRLSRAESLEMVLRLGPRFAARVADASSSVEIAELSGRPVCRVDFEAGNPLELSARDELWAPRYGARERICAIHVRSERSADHSVSWTLAWNDTNARVDDVFYEA